MRIKTMVLPLAFLMLAGSGCRADREADESLCRSELVKAQEIEVVPAGDEKPLATITAQADIDAFVQALDVDHWQIAALPDDVSEVGTFRIAQQGTIHFGQTESGGPLDDVATLTLYEDSYVRAALCDPELTMTFTVGEDAAQYMSDYFEE